MRISQSKKGELASVGLRLSNFSHNSNVMFFILLFYFLLFFRLQ